MNIHEGIIDWLQQHTGVPAADYFANPGKYSKTPRDGWAAKLWRHFTQWDNENHERFPDIWTMQVVKDNEGKGWIVIDIPEQIIAYWGDFYRKLAAEIVRGYQLSDNAKLEDIGWFPAYDRFRVEWIDEPNWSLAWDSEPSSTISTTHIKVEDVELRQYGLNSTIRQLYEGERQLSIRLRAGANRDVLYLKFGYWELNRMGEY